MADTSSPAQAPAAAPGGAPPRGRADKRAAIVRAARTVFGRDGYSRSSIDAIAAEAAVSTRTIYNHFSGKEELFSSVLQASATQVADAFVAAIGEAPREPLELERELLALGEALVAQVTEHADHFAMVRQINAEARHFPPGALDAWQEAGPLRVERAVAERLRQLGERGVLRVEDPLVAARHFNALTTAEIALRSYHGALPLPPRRASAMIGAGVRAFLNGYAA